MRLYRVSLRTEERLIQGFAGSQADASKARQTLVDKFGVRKAAVEIQEVDVPTQKAGLLDYLNKLVGAV